MPNIHMDLQCKSLPTADQPSDGLQFCGAALDLPKTLSSALCRRFLNFLHTCAGCDNELVRFIVRHGITYGGMSLLCGRNSLFCAKRYWCYQGDFLMSNFSSNIVKVHYYDNISAADLSAVSLLMELTFVWDNIFSLTGIYKDNINELILLFLM